MDMQIVNTELRGVVIIEVQARQDARGFFFEAYNHRQFVEHGLDCQFVQDNHSRSIRNVLRGFHFQDMTAPLVKLVRCTTGRILDVVVDLRVGSPTFGRWMAEELSAENRRQLWVPVGCGHAFLTLSEFAEVQYKCSNYYTPAAEGVVAWNDPDLAVEWPIPDPILSGRDQAGMSLRDYLRAPRFSFETGSQLM
jgi:dTDP-4-dehydrorhamnose 3,5-epimerase